jgi:hypothetical protein
MSGKNRQTSTTNFPVKCVRNNKSIRLGYRNLFRKSLLMYVIISLWLALIWLADDRIHLIYVHAPIGNAVVSMCRELMYTTRHPDIQQSSYLGRHYVHILLTYLYDTVVMHNLSKEYHPCLDHSYNEWPFGVVWGPLVYFFCFGMFVQRKIWQTRQPSMFKRSTYVCHRRWRMPTQLFLESLLAAESTRNKVARFLLVEYTNTGKIYQITTKYTKMAIKYTNIWHCKTLQNLPKLRFLVW